MTRSSKIALATVVCGLFGWLAACRLPERAVAAQTMSQRVTMDIRLERSTSELALDIRLTSNLEKPVRVYQSALPWAAWHSMVLVAAKANLNGDVLNRFTPIDDPSPTITILSPGVATKGRIPLNERFPDLAKALQESDVLLFWSYQLRPIDGVPLERQGGWFLIPKSAE